MCFTLITKRLIAALRTSQILGFEQVNGFLKKENCSPYQGTTEVKHLLWALVGDYGLDKLKNKVKRPLTGLKCASFYGCYLARGDTTRRYRYFLHSLFTFGS